MLGSGENPGPIFAKKVEHTNQNLYNKSTPTHWKEKRMFYKDNNTAKLLDMEDIIVKRWKTTAKKYMFSLNFPVRCRSALVVAWKQIVSTITGSRRSRIIPFGKTTYLHLRKRRYCCEHCGKRFTEKNSLVPRYYRLTRRCVVSIHPATEKACQFHGSRTKAQRIGNKCISIFQTDFLFLYRTSGSSFHRWIQRWYWWREVPDDPDGCTEQSSSGYSSESDRAGPQAILCPIQKSELREIFCLRYEPTLSFCGKGMFSGCKNRSVPLKESLPRSNAHKKCPRNSSEKVLGLVYGGRKGCIPRRKPALWIQSLYYRLPQLVQWNSGRSECSVF